MLANRFNPLRSKQDDAPPAGGGKAAAQESEAGGEAGENNGDEGGEAEDGDPEEPADPEKPAAPAASAPVAPKLNALERGALRALGLSGLVARVEAAEGALHLANAEVVRLNEENAKLSTKVTAFEKETPAKIAAAAKGRENEVSKKVTAELSSLGITPDAAPSQIGAEQTPEAMLEHFATLKGAERTAYWRANSKVLKAADSKGTAKNN